jgi:chondroitin sulfate synthase
MGGSGVILSHETFVQLGPWLDQCYRSELLTKHEDVELGRCILTHVHIGCTTAYNSKVLFYHHYGPRYLFGYDFTPSILSQAFILHPIDNRTTFRQIFSFYQRKQQQQQRIFHLIKSKSMNRINYVTFLNTMEFDLVRDIHYQLIDVRWKAYIDLTVQSYIQHLQRLWYQRSSNWTIINGKFLFGYHRVIPRYGLELIVEVLLNARSISISRSVVVRKRFHLRQTFVRKTRFDYREVNNLDLNDDKSRLNLIVISSNKDDALKRFVNNFQYEILDYSERHQQFSLTILYFLHKQPIIDYIQQLSVRYSSIFRLIILNQTEHEYNRGYGRQLASKYFTMNQLLFFLDVDILFTGQSLINTRRLILHQLSISSCAVYFPIIYSDFSNMFTIHNHSMMNVQTNFGLFSIYGFGNVAVRKKDLERIGGWEINNHDWGVEDGNLFERFVNISADCSVFRAVEPGLRHYYHKKMCDGIENKVRQKMCFDAEAILLGSQTDMINYIFNNQILKDND